MTPEENVAAVRRLVDTCVNAHRADLLDDHVNADVRVHAATPGDSPETVGIEELRAAFRGLRTVLGDLHVTVDDVVAAGDRVVVRWTATGVHTGELAGVPATGRPVRWGGTDVYRLDDGRIAEWWRNDDQAGLLAQLTAVAPA
ncbi:ester cyclase [Modestobacter versicolor]|uniref:ester cyclase n=1 Tax=Modestobacter versicolor TaxID=429133 RepID=UPI0034DFBD5D